MIFSRGRLILELTSLWTQCFDTLFVLERNLVIHGVSWDFRIETRCNHATLARLGFGMAQVR